MIPLFINCSGRRIVIFGGGAVAARKASYFVPEARVLVISRSFVQRIESMDIERRDLDIREITDAEIASLIRHAFLVIGALSDPEQNNRIGSICTREGILFNNADGEPGDVTLPATSRGENFSLAISTGGSSPAISRFIREYLEEHLPGLDAMILLQRRLREELKHTDLDQVQRKAILQKVLQDPLVWKQLNTDPDLAWNTVSERLLHG